MRTNLKTWNERLVWALKDRDVSKSELARACKIERASMTEWTNGKTRNPQLAPFFAACVKLRIRPRWLALGEPPVDALPGGSTVAVWTELLTAIAEQLTRLSEQDQRIVLKLVSAMQAEGVPRPIRATAGAHP
jgi:transcriptional regulator with XRE-family HTH domain